MNARRELISWRVLGKKKGWSSEDLRNDQTCRRAACICRMHARPERGEEGRREEGRRPTALELVASRESSQTIAGG